MRNVIASQPAHRLIHQLHSLSQTQTKTLDRTTKLSIHYTSRHYGRLARVPQIFLIFRKATQLNRAKFGPYKMTSGYSAAAA